jgi:hypothetical protein
MAQIQPIARYNNKKVASLVTATVAIELVGLFGLGYATGGNVMGVDLLAATSIFIDGTKDILPTNDSQAPDRMRDALNGHYDQCPTLTTCASGADQNVYIDYSRDFGILTGGVGYDVSRTEARDKTIQAIRDAQADNGGASAPIYVVGYSQGSNAASDVIDEAARLNSDRNPDGTLNTSNDLDLSNTTFVLTGNGARNDGGLWARLPGVYVPLIGLSFGQSTNPSDPNDPNAPGQIIMISKQYDGASDWPKYVLTNPLSAANAALGFVYVHNGYYADSTAMDDLDTNDDGKLDQSEINAADQDKYIITQNGNVVDVVVKNEPGQLPLTQPLRALGVPDSVILAMDPILRAIIDAGYERPTDGVYPATPVHFGLVPGPGKTVADVLSIAAAVKQTESNLDTLNAAPIQAASPSPLSKEATPEPPVAPPAPPANQHKWPTFLVSHPVPQAAPPVVEETPTTRQVLVDNQTLSGGSTTVSPSGSTGGGSGLPVLKNVATAINGAVTGTLTAVQDALTPKKPSTPAPAASEPATTP